MGAWHSYARPRRVRATNQAHPQDVHDPAFRICRSRGRRALFVLPTTGGTIKMLISASEIALRHGQNTGLGHVDLHLNAGEIVTIVGLNRSGKSSLLRVLITASTPEADNVTCQPNLKIGYVLQKTAL